MIYYVDFPENLSPEECEARMKMLLPLLPAFRQEKALHFKSPKEGLESACAYLLLHFGLSKEYPALFNMKDTGPLFYYDQHKKPYLAAKDASGIHFNISHCKNGIACGIHTEPIGIDIQDIRPRNAALIQKLMSGKNIDSDESFSCEWSRIEAIGKLMSRGLAHKELSSFSNPDYIQQEKIHIFTYKKAASFLSAAFYHPSTPLPLEVMDFSVFFEMLMQSL